MSVLADDGALPPPTQPAGLVGTLPAATAAALSGSEVLQRLGASAGGLTSAEAEVRLAVGGPNAVRSHHARALHVLARQLRSAILLLLVVTAAASYLLGNKTDAVIIGVILLASGRPRLRQRVPGRAGRSQALHAEIRHTASVLRDGQPRRGGRHAIWCPATSSASAAGDRAGRPAAARRRTAWSATSRS